MTKAVDRICRQCGRLRPLRMYTTQGPGRTRCELCRSASTTPAKVNARGDIFCFHCRQYLPAVQFKRHPSANRWWSYCYPCCRIKDRERYAQRVATPDGRALEMRKRLQRKHRQRRGEHAERTHVMASSILLLRKRGLTKAEIARLLETSFTSILEWERRERLPTEAATRRMGRLVQLTIDWPIGEPCYRRRLPHPLLAELQRAMQPTIIAFPLRSRWKDRQEDAA